MATNLGTNFLQEYSVSKKKYTGKFQEEVILPKKENVVVESPSVSTIQLPIVRKQLTKLNISLISFVFFLMMVEAFIYSHNVQSEVNANRLQSEITKIRETNYLLNVELAKSKELHNVEKVATSKYKMRAAESNEINYLPMPSNITDKSSLITKVNPVERKLEIPVGY